MLNRLYIVTVFLLISGCVTVPPIQHDLQAEEKYAAVYGDVWQLVTGFLSDENISVKTGNKESGAILTSEVEVPYEGFQYVSDYCDCGRLGGLYVYHEIKGEYKIQISRLAEKVAAIRIDSRYRASLWLGEDFVGWVPCESKGYFEKKLFEQLTSKFKTYQEEKDKKPAIKENIPTSPPDKNEPDVSP
ncbi:MAG: hypothetical protein HZB61_04140 [Nitrospirae bacterium]|nr:hypothetical protein [Nitrospirota bacterium]